MAGGFGSRKGSITRTAELYDPATGLWTATGRLGTPRAEHTATLLPSGKVVATAGLNEGGYLSSVELYDQGVGFDSN